MKQNELKKMFEKEVLENTCFKTLKELLMDKTSIEINAPRALIAVSLCGVWRGMNIMNDKENKGGGL